MSIEQFELIMCDIYEMDSWMPEPVFRKREFAKVSYQQWAIDEFRNYLAEWLYPRAAGTVDEFIDIAEDFIEKMQRFSELNPVNEKLFLIARDTVIDIKEVFQAMK